MKIYFYSRTHTQPHPEEPAEHVYSEIGPGHSPIKDEYITCPGVNAGINHAYTDASSKDLHINNSIKLATDNEYQPDPTMHNVQGIPTVSDGYTTPISFQVSSTKDSGYEVPVKQ